MTDRIDAVIQGTMFGIMAILCWVMAPQAPDATCAFVTNVLGSLFATGAGYVLYEV